MINKLFFSITLTLVMTLSISTKTAVINRALKLQNLNALFAKLFSFSFLFSVFKIKTLANNLKHKTLTTTFTFMLYHNTFSNKKHLPKSIRNLTYYI